jgi:endonuclease/exonuclease/phosphatase family metal-dependent hydrolase
LSNTHFDQAGVVARAESARLVVDRLSLLTPKRIVLGDLNADETSEAAEIFTSAGYRDTYRVLHPDAEACTYHGFRGRGVRSLGKIDYIFCDESWATRSAGIVRDSDDGRYPSDHFPVVAELDVGT